MPKIIVIGTLKGGVGKTSAVFNIGGFLAEAGNKVLVLDNDPQGNTTNNFGINKRMDGIISTSEIYEENIPADVIILNSPIPELPTLDLIPATIRLTKTEMEIISLAGRELILKNWFKKNKDILEGYDYILIDTSPSMSVVNQNAFIIADCILIISDVGLNSLDGAEYFYDLWNSITSRLNIPNRIAALIINKFRKGVNVDKQYLEYLSEHSFKDLVLKTVVPLNTKLTQAELNNQPINIYDKTATGYHAYAAIIEELKDRGVL